MRFQSLLVCFGLFATIASSGSYAEGDKVIGQQLAQELCTNCHNVEPDGPFKQFPPSFASIAVYRTAEQVKKRIAVPPVQENMPKVSHNLEPADIENLVAYIMSLETN